MDVVSSRASSGVFPFLFKGHLLESLACLDQTSPAMIEAQVLPRDDVLVMLDSALAMHPHELRAQRWRELSFQRRPIGEQFDRHGDTPLGLRSRIGRESSAAKGRSCGSVCHERTESIGLSHG
jgi:hypothetical protein